MDLDHFKEVNDTFGHHVGDLLLREIGPHLRSELRAGDTIARLGGDEFAVLLPGAGPVVATGIAERLLAALGRPFVIEGQPLSVGASIGISCSPEHATDAQGRCDRGHMRGKSGASRLRSREKSGASRSRSREQRREAHMATATIVRTEVPTDRLALSGIRNGLVASLAMAMVMMVLGAFDTGFFAAPSSIWAFFAGPSAYAPHTLSLSFVIGAMGHMMNSAIFGIVFAFIALRLLRVRAAVPSVVAGTVFALVVMAIMWNVVLPLGQYGDIVKQSAALWIWILGHAAYGMTGGLLLGLWR